MSRATGDRDLEARLEALRRDVAALIVTLSNVGCGSRIWPMSYARGARRVMWSRSSGPALRAFPSVIAILLALRHQAQGDVSANWRARDGRDTMELGEMAIRLQGLAAPEWNEPGGTEAREAMIELVHHQTVRCELDGSRTYDRCVGVCYLDGRDIAESLVSVGLARDCPRYSKGRYAVIEAEAAADAATIGQNYRLPAYCRPR